MRVPFQTPIHGRVRGALAVAASFAALAAAAPASAIVIADGTSDSAYTSAGSAYSQVGQFYGHDSSGAFAASGVIVSADSSGSWVLTAGHVTSGATALSFYMDGGGSWSSFASRTGYAADNWVTYGKYDGNLTSGYDIGLVHFSQNLATLGGSVATLYTGSQEPGQVATAVGYGMTGTGTTGATTFDGLKRAGENTIDAIALTPGKSNRILLEDFDNGDASNNSYGSADPLSMESLIAPGDSGGGLFLSCGGTGVADDCLAGITSFSWGRLDGDPNSDYGDVAGFTRVSSFLSWIEGIIGTSSGGGGGGGGGGGHGHNGNRTNTALFVPTPAPATLGIFAVGLFGIAALRRRRAR